MRYSIEPRTRKDIKAYRFLWFARNQFDKYGKNVLNTATKTGLDPAKTASKKYPSNSWDNKCIDRK